jgi:hypothetical protein
MRCLRFPLHQRGVGELGSGQGCPGAGKAEITGCKSDYRLVAMALDGSNALGLHAAKHKAVFGNDQRLLEQERIGRAIADRPGDRIYLRENLGLFP